MANLSSKTGFTPVQTQVNFSAVNVATTIQNFAAYDSQELSGFVYVTTSSFTLRASVKVVVNKNGAGTYEVASVDVAGDNISGAPIVSFVMSGSNLQATLSSSITGTWSSGYIRYQLSAPALGGNFPLTVSASQVQGRVSGTSVIAGYVGERIASNPGLATTPAASSSFIQIASITLTPGIWRVTGLLAWVPSGTTYTRVGGGISLSNTSMDAITAGNFAAYGTTSSESQWLPAGSRYFNVSSNTSVYLLGQVVYTVLGTATFSTNSQIEAIRIA